MNKKTVSIVVLVIIVVIAVGAAFLLRKPNNTNNSSLNNSQNLPANNSVFMVKSKSVIGNYLADPKGNTLYTDGVGNAGVQNCLGACLAAWPPYLDKFAGTSINLPLNIGTIKRSDNGEVQFTYKNQPLYYFSADSNGQVTGNGISGFSVALP